VTRLTEDTIKEIDEIFSRYQEELWNAMEDETIQLALSRAIASFRRNKEEALKLYPKVREKAKELKKVKVLTSKYRRAYKTSQR
jgi:L-lactate utilization protein LutB